MVWYGMVSCCGRWRRRISEARGMGGARMGAGCGAGERWSGCWALESQIEARLPRTRG